jgi:hypothetical protein
MIFDRHTSIIPNHINVTHSHLARREIPVARITNIGFIHTLTIHVKPAMAKFDAIPLHCDDPFEQHHFVPSKTDRDHIGPFRRGKKVTQPPAKIETTVMVSRFHTGPSNADWNQEITENQVG